MHKYLGACFVYNFVALHSMLHNFQRVNVFYAKCILGSFTYLNDKENFDVSSEDLSLGS